MYEELMTDHESKHALESEDMFIILPEMRDYVSFLKENKYGAKATNANHILQMMLNFCPSLN